MINRLRNVLNWIAFASLTVIVFYLALAIYVDGSNGLPINIAAVLTFKIDKLYWWASVFYGYALLVLIQYVVWKEPVFLPWKFKVDEE